MPTKSSTEEHVTQLDQRNQKHAGTAEILIEPADILAARRMQAERYLSCGYVEALGSDGAIDDQWVKGATYFGVRDGEGGFTAVSRLISRTPGADLPIGQLCELDRPWDLWLDHLADDLVHEVSALAISSQAPIAQRFRALDALIAAMSVYSLGLQSRFWVAVIDRRVYRMIRRLHGANLQPIGPVQDLTGYPTIPIKLDLHEQARTFGDECPDKNEHFLEGMEIDLTGDSVVIRPAVDLCGPHHDELGSVTGNLGVQLAGLN